MAFFEEFSTLRFIILNSRWAGASTEEQALREYLSERLQKAIRRLPKSADVLAEAARRDNRNSGAGR
jgi:hypothetical protein